MPTAEEILRDYKSIYEEFGELNQQQIKENTDYVYRSIYEHFEGLSESKLCTKIASSDYASYSIPELLKMNNYRKPMREILEGCERKNGKVTQDIIGDDVNIPNNAQYTKRFGSLSLAKLRADLSQDSILHLTDEELEELEDEMIEEMQRCKDKNGKTTVQLYREMDTDVSVRHITRHFGTFSKAKLVALDDPGITHKTDKEMRGIEKDLENDDMKKEILKGLLMGDGTIGKTANEKRNNLEVEMTNRDFLDWTADQLGDLVSSVRKSRVAEDIAEKNRRHGYTVNEEDIEDEHVLSTVTTDFTTRMRDKWYPEGEKKFPDDLELSPLSTKIWYVCDGSLVQNEHCVIYSCNERDRPEFMKSLFNNTPFNPSFSLTGGGGLQFTRSESREFLDWLGEPVPGYEYKWNINE